MAEWHVTPAYINANWTEEMLALFFEKREWRLTPPNKRVHRLNNNEFFTKAGMAVNVVRLPRQK